MKRDGGMDWICLAQNRHRWRAVVNATMNILFLRGVSWLAEELLATQERLLHGVSLVSQLVR